MRSNAWKLFGKEEVSPYCIIFNGILLQDINDRETNKKL